MTSLSSLDQEVGNSHLLGWRLTCTSEVGSVPWVRASQQTPLLDTARGRQEQSSDCRGLKTFRGWFSSAKFGAHTAPPRSGAQALSLLLHQAQHGASTPTAASWVKWSLRLPPSHLYSRWEERDRPRAAGTLSEQTWPSPRSSLGSPTGHLLLSSRGALELREAGRSLCCSRQSSVL